MQNLVYLSRSFVEFGPFSTEEMTAFYSRGLLQEIDHIRPEGGDSWLPVVEWINSLPAPQAPAKAAKPAKKAAPAAKKAAAPKKTAAPVKKTASKPAKPKP
jgi:hypothetical protein